MGAKKEVNIIGPWEEAIEEAIQKPKPKDGWPKPDPVPQRAPLNPKKGPRTKKKAPE